MTIEIIKNIDMEQLAPRAASQRTKYPWKKLEVGDGFLVEVEPEKTKSVQLYAYSCAKRYGMKFSTRTTDKGVFIVRVA